MTGLGAAATSSDAGGVARASAQAGARTVDLALVLAIDASGSIDDTTWKLQMDGYAAAFRHPAVQAALRAAGRSGTIAVTVTEWSGAQSQAQAIAWTLLDSAEAAQALAAQLGALGRIVPAGATSVSGAIDHAARLLMTAPARARRMVIDVSGDGEGRDGRPAADARDQAVARGIVINGLPIRHYEPWVETWYAENVVAGPGSFLIVAEEFDSFGEAVRKKLAREIAGREPPREARRVP